MSFLGKKSYGKINEKYQSPPSEKTSTPFELLLPPKNQNSANSPPFLLISKKYYSSLCYSRHSSAATIDQLLKSPATYWIRSFTKSHCYKCYLLISAMEPNIINISISFHTRLNRNSTVTIHQKNIQILTTDSKTIKIFVHLYWIIFSTLRINHLETRRNYQIRNRSALITSQLATLFLKNLLRSSRTKLKSGWHKKIPWRLCKRYIAKVDFL